MRTLLLLAGQVVGAFRWAYMPFGLFALVAVGVHAGADAVDDHVLAFLDAADGALDRGVTALLRWLAGSVVSVNASTVDGWVFAACDAVGMRERESLAKGLALALEIIADVALAFPALGYHEDFARPPSRAEWVSRVRGAMSVGPLRGLALAIQAIRDPTVLRLSAPLATLLVAVAGACTIAREAETAAFGVARELTFAPGWASSVSQLLGILVLGAVAASLGARALGRSLEHAHLVGEADRAAPRVARRLRGLPTAAIVLPLSIVAFLHGAPVASFFR